MDSFLTTPDTIVALCRVLGLAPELGKAQRCPIAAHDDEHPSAALWRRDDGHYVLHDFHGRGPEWLLLPQVYAAQRLGVARALHPAELAAWSLRLVEASGLVSPAPVAVPRIATLTAGQQRVLDGFVRVFGMARALGVEAVPFTREFAASYCDVGTRLAKETIALLLRQGAIVPVAEYDPATRTPTLWRLGRGGRDPRTHRRAHAWTGGPALSAFDFARVHDTATGSAALKLAELGLSVVPVCWPSADGCAHHRNACAHPGKRPLVKWTPWRGRRPDATRLARWWLKWPSANVGIIAGPASGVAVLDVDTRNGGDATLARLVERFGPLPATWEVKTSGGAHYYFRRVPALRSRAAGGLELRANDLVIAPPSLHESGARYTWRVLPRVGELADLPAWLAENIGAAEP